jgi:small-conductance mechanosensitive channel
MTEPTDPAPNNPEHLRSPRRGMCAAVLSFEAVILLLSAPVMITVASVPAGRGISIVAILTLLCLLAVGALRSKWGYRLGWVIQLALVAMGFVVATMFVIGLIFAGLWAAAYFLGLKIERERAAAYAAAHQAR